MTNNPQLEILRHDIEQVTLKIVELVGKRNVLVERVAVEKLKTGQTLVNREVERRLRVKVVDQCKEDNSDASFALKLLNELIMESIRRQERHLKPQETLNAYHIFIKSKELERAGKEVIHLEVGEPDFGPPAAVSKSLTEAAIKGHIGYTESSGILELRSKIADYVTQAHGSAISADQVAVTVGGRFALYLSLVTSLKQGDEVIIIDPSYPAYADCVRQAGGKPVHVTSRLEDDWNPDTGRLEESINETTRMIILNSPSNPTGKTLDNSTIEKIVELSIDHDLLVVSDEAYSEFSFSPHISLLQFPECNQIHINSFSKTFGMTGFRLGYSISDVELTQKITKLQNISLTSVPEFIQHAGIKALDCLDEAKKFTALIKKRQKSICDQLEKLPVSFHRPDGGFYIFPRLNDEASLGTEFAERLLIEKGVAVVPGISYGQEYSRYFRISVCQPENSLVEAVNRMEEILE